MKAAGVVFDLDGTLVDSFAAIHHALVYAMKALGAMKAPEATEALGLALPTYAETRRMVGLGLERLLEQAVGTAHVAAALPHYRRRYREIAVAETTLLPGADACTAWLHAHGVPLVIASNKPSEFSRLILDGLGVASRFVAIYGPDNAGAAKPDPLMLHRAVEAIGAAARDIWYVGDMYVDVETARAAGVPVALVAQGSADPAAITALAPDAIFETLDALLLALQKA